LLNFAECSQKSIGLNLQSGSVVINMDIPWNPAIGGLLAEVFKKKV
jgi:hypothetical protein